jgi:Zn-dependent protease
MNSNVLENGLIWYACLVLIITVHEFAHAWTASKLGDPTAKSKGRVTLNPIAHIDMIGTVAIPFLIIFLMASGSGLGAFIIGWGKPVPVNPIYLKNVKRDEILIAMAGPLMNIILALIMIVIAKIAFVSGQAEVQFFTLQVVFLSLLLCFFNLIPVPPLDGSHPLRHLIGMKDETYQQFARFGFIILIVLINIPFVGRTLYALTDLSYKAMTALVGGFG